MSRYVLKTWFGTFVYYDAFSDRLRHAPAGHIPQILTLQSAAGHFSFDFSPHIPVDLLAHKLGRGEFLISGKSMSECNVRVAGFMSADAIGLIVSDRNIARECETFSLVPLDQIRHSLGSDLGATRTIIALPRSQKIPSAIHQIYISTIDNLKNRHLLPDIFQENVRAIRKLNPGFSYKLWTMKDIHDAIYEWYGFEILSAYMKINPRYGAARADFFRYLLMYKCGGIYLDLKSGLSKPLSDILLPDDGYILSNWDEFRRSQRVGQHVQLQHKPSGEYQTWFIICERGHPYLESVINQVLENIATYDRRRVGVGRPGVLRTTGPIPYTLAIDKILDRHTYRMIEAEAEGLVPGKVAGGQTVLGRHYSEVTDDVVL